MLENQNMQGLILFAQISRMGSLSAAAQLLGISRSSVSKQLSGLEKKIGSRLLNRTTRKIVLTDVGRQILKEANNLELALKKIDQIGQSSQSVIQGDLKVSCACAHGRKNLAPSIVKFLERHPAVNVNLQLENRNVNLLTEQFDLAIRFGDLPDSTLIARKICELSGVLCASPVYLRNSPPLNTPSDLLNHRCLVFKSADHTTNSWVFTGAAGEERVTVSGQLSINDPSALISAALAHGGVLLTQKILLSDELSEGKLVPVLNQYKLAIRKPVYIVYPEAEFLPAKTRALVDFLAQEIPAIIEGT